MSQEKKPSAAKRLILPDMPSEADEFSGGGHQRTANALADTIVQFEDADHAIGLEGSWGSGKSTIVKLAEKVLEESDKKHKYHVFTFDLWANQTGHFKRAFLESFLSWSSSRFQAENAFLEEKKDQVGDRTQTVTTHNTRRFSWFGVAAIVFLYFSPLIYAWLTPSAFINAQGEPVIRLGAKLAWSAITIMSVLLLWAIVSIWPAKGGFLQRLQGAVSGAFAVFSKEAERTTIEQNIRDEDPTQYEFTRIFREIVARLQSKNDRIVVVFDNIDRLPSDRIADEWSEVRSAFYGDHSGTVGKTEITAIVPYARSVTLAAVVNKESASQNGRTQYLDADLFRKSFDAIFHVSPPILSDAATFFIRKFREATFAYFEEAVEARVYRIFDLQVQKTGYPTTPRQVIAFINDVTSWWVQWQGQIPVETIAVFVIYQDQLVRDPGSLRTGGVIEDRMVQHANQANFIRDLAALAYNVPPEMALQILSHDAISQALVADTPDQLQELVKGSPENGFPDVLTQVVDEFASEWAEDAISVFGNVVTNIAAVSQTSNLFGYTKRVLSIKAKQLGSAAIGDFEKADKIWNAVSLVDANQVAGISREILAWISRALPPVEKQEVEHGRQWIQVVGNFLDRIKERHGVSAVNSILSSVALPSGSKAIVGAAIDCDETNYHLNQFRSVAQSQKSIADTLTEFAGHGSLFHYAWAELHHIFNDQDKVTLLSIPIDYLKATNIDAGSKELQSSLKNIRHIYPTISIGHRSKSPVVKDFYESGAAIHYAYGLGQTKTGEDSDALATLVWLAMEEFGLDRPSIPNVQGVPTFGNIQAAFNWFVAKLETEKMPEMLSDQVASYVVESGGVEHFVKRATEESEERESFKSVVRKLVLMPDFRPPSFALFAGNFAVLKRMLDDDLDTLLAAVGVQENKDYWASIPFEKLPVELVSIVSDRKETGWGIFLQKLDEWLNELDSDTWSAALSDNSTAVSMLLLRNQQSSLTAKVANFYEPLLLNALSIIAGEQESVLPSDTFLRLVKCLPPNSQNQFSSDFFKRHSAHSKGIVVALETFEPILSSMPFTSDPSKTIEGYLLPLLKEASEEAYKFILKNEAVFKKVLKKADTSKSGLIIELLDSKSKNEDNADRVGKIRKSLGLKEDSDKKREIEDDK